MKKFGIKGTILLIVAAILMFGSAGAVIFNPGDCPSGMVSYWTFDDQLNPGKDDYGNNHGTSIVNADWDANGKVGGAMRFYGTSYSGEDSYIDIGTGTVNLQTLSVAAWVKSAVSYQYWGCYISNCQPGYDWDQWAVWWGCCAYGEGRQDNITFGVQGLEGFSGNTDLDTNWHFVVVVNDMANNERRIYVDGQLDGTSTAFTYGNQGSQGHLRIGQDTCYDERFNGWVDEIAIFNRVLTASEIQQMYNRGLNGTGYCGPEVTPTPVPSPTPGCPSGMVSYWEAEGNAQDSFDSNHGSMMNGATFASGKVGQAFCLDGVDDHVNFGPMTELDSGSEFTLSAWIKHDLVDFTGFNHGIISQMAGPDYPVGDINDREQFWLGLEESVDRIVFYARGTSTHYGDHRGNGIGADVSFSDGQWHLVTATWKSNDVMKIYVDGIEVASDWAAIALNNPDVDATIGSMGPWEGGFFDGAIDEVAIFNSVLSQSEIQQMYNNGLAGKGYCETVTDGGEVYQEDPDEEHPDYDHSLQGFYYYVTYNKPSGAITAKWRVKHGGYDPYEIDIPQDCWDADPAKLMLRLYSNSNDGMGQSVSWPECYDGSNWVAVGKTAIDSFGGSGTYSGPIYMTDGDWNTYNVWNEIGPVSSTWQTNYSRIAPRWYEEGIWFGFAVPVVTPTPEVTPTPVPSPTPGCPNGMVSYWTFDDSADPGNDDYNGHDGTVEGATWTSSGRVAGAMYFDDNDGIYIGDMRPLSTSPTGSVTYVFWAKPDYDNQVLVWKGYPWDDKAGDMRCALSYGQGQMSISAIINAGQNLVWYPSFVWTTYVNGDNSVYHHVACIYDSDKLYVYFDGQLVNTADVPDGISDISNSNPLVIGRQGPLSYPYDTSRGYIDEVAVFNRALTASEIQQMYNNGLNGTGYCAPSKTEIINDLVTFDHIQSTYQTTSDTTGCGDGFVGQFSFDATLRNKSDSGFSLSDLVVKVRKLTKDNLLQNADGGAGGEGASLKVPEVGDCADGILSPGESVDVHFIICLKKNGSFKFLVDVLGVKETVQTGQTATSLDASPVKKQLKKTKSRTKGKGFFGRFRP